MYYIWKSSKLIQKKFPIYTSNISQHTVNSNIILIVGMLNSPHFHTWLGAVQSEFPERKLILFPSDRPRLTKINLKKLQSGHKKTKVIRFIPSWRLNYFWSVLMDKTIGISWRSYFLGRVILKNKPAIAHFHEMQHGAYIYNYLVGYPKISSNMKTIISTWGSDLTLYSWVDAHKVQLETSLGWAKILTAEKNDEVNDAIKLGFKGDFIAPVYIHLGREPRSEVTFLMPSKRNKIFLKGYQGSPGRALNALNALIRIKPLLKNFEILVYSTSEAVEIQIDLMRNRDGMNIRTISGTHKEMQELFHTARVSIGLSVSDGLPASFVESIYAGCFPIQSENSAIREFIKNGENGFLLDPWDIAGIERALKMSLTDDDLVDKASEINRIVLNKKYDLKIGLKRLRSLYI